jgi:hypothetical protein
VSVEFFGADTGVTLTCEIALSLPGGVYGRWGRSLWGRATWGPGTVYTDLSTRIRAFGTGRKFDRKLSAWSTGRGWVLLDNRDGELSPENLAGTYTSGGVTLIRPGRRIRLRAAYGGATFGLICGVIDDWQEEIISAGPSMGDAAVRIPIVDDWAELAAVDGEAQASAGAGELFGARVHRILDGASWRGPRAVDVGSVTMQATTLAKSPVQELALTAFSEGGGLVWPDADGVMLAADRYARTSWPRSTIVQATFGDQDPSHLPYSNPRPTYDRALILNRAAYTRIGGVQQVAQDDASRAVYRLKSDVRADLICETDAQVLEVAQWAVATGRQPRRRIERITVYPRVRPADLWPVVLGARHLDLWRTVHHPPGGYTSDVYGHVSGISHTVMPGGQWTSDFDLWSADPYYAFSGSRWGRATWGQSKWFI